ncbi:MAG TPA: uroporphyrinogen-III synthase [Gammaproteobacteria bacterium]|nr:uroporphyrinogen-III synthase [Gammaproteobacteria bacterium]
MPTPETERGPLHGLHIMNTRPAHQAEALSTRLREAGAEVYEFPVLAIAEPTDPGPLHDLLARLDDFQLAIFISPNAVDRTLNRLAREGRQLPPSLKLATIGRGGTRALRQHLGRDADICPTRGADSEALLAHPELQDVAGQRIIIFRGDGGRELLAEQLRTRGATVEYANVYRRTRPDADLAALQHHWARRAFDAIIVTSGEGLRNLFDMVGPLAQHWLQQTTLVLINERQAAIARQLGCRKAPVLSHSADDAAIVTALSRWHSTGGEDQ